MSKKSYNIQALRGVDVDDSEIADEFREMGVVVPNEILYTPEFPKYLIEQTHELNKTGLLDSDNPITGRKFTEDEAVKRANDHRAAAYDTLKALMK